MYQKKYICSTSELVCRFRMFVKDQFRDLAVEGPEADQNSGPLTTTATFRDSTDSAAATMADAEEGGQYFVDQETGQYYYQVSLLESRDMECYSQNSRNGMYSRLG